jgi:hypothetical protein
MHLLLALILSASLSRGDKGATRTFDPELKFSN